MQQTESSGARQVLSFHAAGEDYAVGILRVREIVPFETVTKLPGAPAAVRGVVNLRGDAVPVVDWSVAAGLGETAISKLSCIVLVESAVGGQGKLLGLLVDSVNQVLDVAADAVKPVPTVGADTGRDYLEGMVQIGKKFTLLLDIDRALAPLVAGVETAPA